MSREFLADVLDKFAQVTSIIVETSKIKEDLDKKSDTALKDLAQRTETQVEYLLELATALKASFSKQAEVNKQLDESNKKDVNSNSSEQSDFADRDTQVSCEIENENVSDSASQQSKPLIKLVDIKKLVEPSTLIKHGSISNERNSAYLDESVVIITSSDEEVPKLTNRKTREVLKKRTGCSQPTEVIKHRTAQTCKKSHALSKRKAAEKTNAKTKVALQGLCSSDSEFSDDEKLSSKVNRIKNGTKKTTQLDSVALLRDSTSDTDTELINSDSKKNKHQGKRGQQISNCDVEDILYHNVDLKTDTKLNSKCYVQILRVPCEKLKEYYLEKLELLEINKLQDLNPLKRKRKHLNSNSSSTSQENQKSKNMSRSKQQKEDSDADSVSSEDVDLCQENVDTPVVADCLANSHETNSIAADQMAEDALDLLHSDKEQENGSDTSAEEGPGKNQNKSGKARTHSPDDKDTENISDKKDSSTNKKSDQTEMHSDANEQDVTNDSVTNNSDINKEKKKWRNNKLLTARLSSTDSDLEHFNKTKRKIQENGSDGPNIPQDKKKRLKKRRIKKAIFSDSDSDAKCSDSQPVSGSSSSQSEQEKESKEDNQPQKPKRKRVKRVRDSSEDDEEKSTRKQIRNILDRDSLAETTKKAEDEERQRKARILEKQKKYNQAFESGAQQNSKVEKVVLDYDEKNNKELLKLDEHLVSKLKPHQASGVQFMWDACFESLERAKKTKGSGCILAHCMGLGKTLQVIALSHALLVNNEDTNVKKILVVSPLNTVLNWVQEFKQWLPNEDDFEVFELVSFKQNYERQYQVKTWHINGGVLIIGYDMFRNLSNPDSKRLSRKMRTTFQEALVDPGPDLVICDEGHLLKNEKTNLSIAMNRIKTMRRIILTGTPLQNNLKEYFCMVQFIKPNLLGTYREYLNRFVNPITNGQYTDSTPHDIQVMRKRSHVLHKMLDGVVQRRDYSVLEPYLPPKFEYVLFLKLSETQIKLYQHYMDHFARRSTDGSNRTSFLFVDFQALQRICTHPRVLLDKSIEMKLAKEKEEDSDESEGSLKDFINDDDEEETSSSNASSENEGPIDASVPRKRVTRAAAALAKENGEEVELVVTDIEEPRAKEWWQEYCDGDQLNDITHSSKLFMLFEILKECEQIGDKMLVFSQSLYSLNVIEYFIGRIHDATQAGNTDSVNGYSGSWCLGLDYFRLDGSSSCDNRNHWCKTFNDPKNTRARLFLISTKAGGLGINLFAANRVIIFDVSWNPSHDIQSIYRVYRFGQTKPSYIYRFVTLGTMEMKIYERQVTKQAISKRVIDEQQIDRHYNQNDLTELYRFEPNPDERPTPLVPKDVLLGELLQKFEDVVYKYHEHQTLLENKEEEGLNEEERKAAWEEFENEKKQRNNWGPNNIRGVNNLDVALINILRKENPTWTDIQIRAMVPTLHAQMQDQVARGDLTLYRRVHQEMQITMALQNQRLKDQYYQQQMMRALQQQQMDAIKFQNMVDQITANQMPSTSHATNAISGDIIELND